MTEPQFKDRPECEGYFWFEFSNHPVLCRIQRAYGGRLMALYAEPGNKKEWLDPASEIKTGRWFGPITKPDFSQAKL